MSPILPREYVVLRGSLSLMLPKITPPLLMSSISAITVIQTIVNTIVQIGTFMVVGL